MRRGTCAIVRRDAQSAGHSRQAGGAVGVGQPHRPDPDGGISTLTSATTGAGPGLMRPRNDEGRPERAASSRAARADQVFFFGSEDSSSAWPCSSTPFSMRIWRSTSELISAPVMMTMAAIHSHIIRPTAAPSEP